MRQLLAFITGDEPPQVHHFLDASAAKAIMERSGVGRVRHLSVRILWSQQLVAEQVIALHKVATSVNVADLNTKGLSRSRLLMLLHILGCWHTLHECFVGEDEIAELRYKQASLVKFQNRSTGPLRSSHKGIYINIKLHSNLKSHRKKSSRIVCANRNM